MRTRLRRLAIVFGSAAILAFGAWYVRQALAPPPPAGGRLKAALEFAERGDATRALELFEDILAEDPDDAEARLYRGQLLHERGRFADALADWRSVPDVPERFGSPARYFEGVELLRRNRARDAERRFLRSIELNPRYLQPRERLLELYVGQRRKEAVRETLAGIRRLRPWRIEECAMHVLAGTAVETAESGTARMTAYATTDPADRESRLARCRYLVDAGDRAAASAALRTLLRDERVGPRAAALLAATVLDEGDVTEAGAILKEHSPGDGSPSDLWAAAGRHAAAAEDWPVAARRFHEAVRLDPFDVAARHSLGTALARSGAAEADAVLEAGTRLDRVERKAFLLLRGSGRDPALLALTAAEIGEDLEALRLHEAAASWFEQAVARSPGDPRAVAGLRRVRGADPPGVAGPPTGLSPDDLPREGILEGSGPRSVVTPSSQGTPPAIRLRDDAGRAGIDFMFANGPSGSKFILETVGGGVAVLDYDLDDRPDLFFPQGGRPVGGRESARPADVLFRNHGDAFEDGARPAGLTDSAYSLGAASADYDGDGFADLAIANFGTDAFYRNNGDGTFDEVTEKLGIRSSGCSSAMAFADFDGDGLSDLYVAKYVADPLRVCGDRNGDVATCDPQNFEADPDRVYRNTGDGRFEDLTAAAGVADSHGKGLGVVAADFDGDGRCDVYVANDGSANYLFLNASGGPGDVRFAEVGLRSGAALSGEGRSQAGMGVACADFDGDGTPDLYVTNFYQETNTVYLNRGGGVFDDATRSSGHAGPTRDVLGFGTQAADLNLDGWPDLAVANGDIDDYSASGRPWKMKPLLFANAGGGRFVEVGPESGDYFLGEYLGRGMARLDWNRDGRPDLAVVHYDRPAALLTNAGDAGRSLSVDLRGVRSNRDGVGAVVRVTAGGRTRHAFVCGGHGYAAANEARLVFGTGDATTVARIEIEWPSGLSQSAEGLPTDSAVSWVEGHRPTVRALRERPVAGGEDQVPIAATAHRSSMRTDAPSRPRVTRFLRHIESSAK